MPPISLRGHHLYGLRHFNPDDFIANESNICYGRSYLDNAKVIYEKLLADPNQEIIATNNPDLLCQICPYLLESRCIQQGSEHEIYVKESDEYFLSLLGYKIGDKIIVRNILKRTSKAF